MLLPERGYKLLTKGGYTFGGDTPCITKVRGIVPRQSWWNTRINCKFLKNPMSALKRNNFETELQLFALVRRAIASFLMTGGVKRNAPVLDVFPAPDVMQAVLRQNLISRCFGRRRRILRERIT